MTSLALPQIVSDIKETDFIAMGKNYEVYAGVSIQASQNLQGSSQIIQ